MRSDAEHNTGGVDPFAKRMPVRHCQDDAEMRDRDAMPVDFLDGGISCGTRHEVDSNLVPVKIEIDPFIRCTAFAATQHASIKSRAAPRS